MAVIELHQPWRDRLALGGLIAEEDGGRILGVESMFSVFSPTLVVGGLKPELGGLSPELGGLSLDSWGGLSIGVTTFLGEVPPGEKELGPVVFRLLAIVVLAEGCFLTFWMEVLRESLGFTSGLVGLEIVAEGVFAEKDLGLTCPNWLVLGVAETLSRGILGSALASLTTSGNI